MKTGTQQNIIITVLICMIAVVLSLCFIFPRKGDHVHGWGKWQDTGRSGYNDWGSPRIEQRRYCTNCGYIQAEIH